MILYPAIDLKNGKCVRLKQGKIEKKTIFNDDPITQAKLFMDEGCNWLHIVDLDGALSEVLINHELIKNLIKNIPIPIQLGGGIRTFNSIKNWISLGAQRIILGTLALQDPKLVKRACRSFPGKIAIGLDAKNNNVMVEGWIKKSNTTILDLAKSFEDAGVAAIIYTDINKDGMMMGPDFEGTKELTENVATPIIASGGVSSIADLQKLKNNCPKLNGIICGRALYDKKICIREAIRVLN